jgi:hypothetical protein
VTWQPARRQLYWHQAWRHDYWRHAWRQDLRRRAPVFKLVVTIWPC